MTINAKTFIQLGLNVTSLYESWLMVAGLDVTWSQYTDLLVPGDFTINTFGLQSVSLCRVFKVPITPKSVFRLNNSLHLFETHCTFLHLFSPNLDFLQAVKVTKSDHHLFHDRASKGYGSSPGLMSQTYLHACLQRLNTMQISL